MSTALRDADEDKSLFILVVRTVMSFADTGATSADVMNAMTSYQDYMTAVFANSGKDGVAEADPSEYWLAKEVTRVRWTPDDVRRVLSRFSSKTPNTDSFFLRRSVAVGEDVSPTVKYVISPRLSLSQGQDSAD